MNVKKILNLEEMVKPVPKDSKFYLDDYYVWCGTMLRTDDGKCHLMYSRWRKELGHYAWVTHSEVAYAVSDDPLGPYKHVNIALAARGKEFWDGCTTHNPVIIQVKDKFYMYYTGTTGESSVQMPVSMKDPNWWEYRNNQRIGVAVADHPQGPWKRFDHPVIDASPNDRAFDSLLVSNPAMVERPEGGVLALYKGVIKGDTYKGGKVQYGVAVAQKPEGPFEKVPGTIFNNEGEGEHWMIAEDPFVCHLEERYYAVTRDVEGLFTGYNGGLALFESFDGIHWEPAEHSKILGDSFMWEDGSCSQTKVERPWLYIENGVPKVLFGAVDVNNNFHREHSFNVQIPLKIRC